MKLVVIDVIVQSDSLTIAGLEEMLNKICTERDIISVTFRPGPPECWYVISRVRPTAK